MLSGWCLGGLLCSCGGGWLLGLVLVSGSSIRFGVYVCVSWFGSLFGFLMCCGGHILMYSWWIDVIWLCAWFSSFVLGKVGSVVPGWWLVFFFTSVCAFFLCWDLFGFLCGLWLGQNVLFKICLLLGYLLLGELGVSASLTKTGWCPGSELGAWVGISQHLLFWGSCALVALCAGSSAYKFLFVVIIWW